MKKQKIQFIVILIVLAVLIAATFGMKWYNKNKEEEKTAEEEASTIYISKVDVDTITAFSYEVDHVTYTFTKDGDTWTYDGDTSLDMDEEAIDSMLSTLSSLTAIEEISDYTDLKEFGFDQPEDLISYTTSEGSVSLKPCGAIAAFSPFSVPLSWKFAGYIPPVSICKNLHQAKYPRDNS